MTISILLGLAAYTIFTIMVCKFLSGMDDRAEDEEIYRWEHPEIDETHQYPREDIDETHQYPWEE